MQTKTEHKSLEQLMAEADDLIRKIKSDAVKDLQEEHRLRFEAHARNIERAKSEVQDRLRRKEAAKLGSGAEGVHAAIQEIVKSMGELKKYLS